MHKLSKRLQAAASFVTPGSRIADIGCDHGYIPVYLVQSGTAPSAIAMDVREGPLARAKEHIEKNHLQQYITTRLSDGLHELEPGEADSVIIAGMGGMLILRILEEGADLASSMKELILEPQSDIAKVRRYVREHGMIIDREDLVLEYGKYYPVLRVVQKKDAPLPDKDVLEWNQMIQERLPDFCCLQQLFDEYGECLIYERHPVLRQLLEKDEKQIRNILHTLSENAKQDKTKLRMRELARRLEEIRILRDIIGVESL